MYLRLLEAVTHGDTLSFCTDNTPENREFIEEKTGQNADAFLNTDGNLEGTIILRRQCR